MQHCVPQLQHNNSQPASDNGPATTHPFNENTKRPAHMGTPQATIGNHVDDEVWELPSRSSKNVRQWLGNTFYIITLTTTPPPPPGGPAAPNLLLQETNCINKQGFEARRCTSWSVFLDPICILFCFSKCDSVFFLYSFDVYVGLT
jgi:hypothetical protein